jgi:hypothetical protein
MLPSRLHAMPMLCLPPGSRRAALVLGVMIHGFIPGYPVN